MNCLVVKDEQGTTVAQGAVENYFVTDDADSGEASNSKTVKIPVPGLKPGYTFECTVTLEYLVPTKELPFQEIALACNSPVRVSGFFIEGDVGQLKWNASNGIELQHRKNVLFAVETNTAPLSYESHQPSVEKFSPVVWLGPAKTTWETAAQRDLDSIDDRLTLDDTTKSLAAELTSGCNSKREKLAAIAEHVQQAYTYHAIEFGRRARIPNTAAKTIALKYGDCKDHAVLTKQLLEAAGITSYLAVVRSSGDIVRDVVSFDQFDHMVVFVPSEEIGMAPNSTGGLVLDTTSKDADPLLDPPWGLDDRSVLVLDREHPRFVHTPKYPEDAGKLVSKRTLAFNIHPSGSVDSDVTEEVTFNAYLAPGMRGLFRRLDTSTRRVAMQSVLSDNGPIRVKTVEAENLDAVRKPLRIKLEYVVPNSFRAISSARSGKSLVGNLPCAWESQFVLAKASTPAKLRSRS